jgi:hypothetical protein
MACHSAKFSHGLQDICTMAEPPTWLPTGACGDQLRVLARFREPLKLRSDNATVDRDTDFQYHIFTTDNDSLHSARKKRCRNRKS